MKYQNRFSMTISPHLGFERYRPSPVTTTVRTIKLRAKRNSRKRIMNHAYKLSKVIKSKGKSINKGLLLDSKNQAQNITK